MKKLSVNVLNTTGEVVSALDLNKDVFQVKENTQVMFDAVTTFTNRFGPTEMVVAVDEVFEELGYKDERFLLFRKVDNAIVPIKKLNETLKDGTISCECLHKLAEPDYHEMVEEDLESKNHHRYSEILLTKQEGLRSIKGRKVALPLVGLLGAKVVKSWRKSKTNVQIGAVLVPVRAANGRLPSVTASTPTSMWRPMSRAISGRW